MKDVKDIKKLTISDIAKMKDKERSDLVDQISSLLFQMKLALSAGQLKNTHFVRILKKNLARIFTYENNKQNKIIT